MFTLFRYGLLPVVLFCGIIVTASIDAFSTNAYRQANWLPTVVRVVESQDFGDNVARLRGMTNDFPDPHGTLKYVVDGKSYTWTGRGRDIGLTVMTPGDHIGLYYNPADPNDISTLVLLGAGSGSIILAAAVAFLAFYAWFFWLGGLLHRPLSDDFDGTGNERA